MMSPIPFDDLAQAAEALRQHGMDACHEYIYGPHGGIEGLEVGDDFFPLWELRLPENQEALERLDFDAIRQRRAPEWTADPPPLRATR